MAQQVYVIDAGVEDADSLLADIPADALVVRLDADRDGVLQLAGALATLDGVSALHIISHGSAGALLLGSTLLDASTIDSYAAAWDQVRAALGNDADILLYGCNVAEGEAGAQFLDALAAATGADVAASDDLTGTGGDWILERSTGSIESVLLSAENYAHTLDLVTGTAAGETLPGTAADDTINGLGGNDNLLGYGGNDLLNGGTGADTMNGNTGDDTYVVDSSLDVIQGEEDYLVSNGWGYYYVAAGWDTVQTSVNNLTLGQYLENLTLTGSANLKGTGNSANNLLIGNVGNNTLDGADGNDTVSGGAGNDSMIGGNGIDAVSYASAGSAVQLTLATLGGQNTGGAGADTIGGFENVIGSGYNDTLTGSSTDNQLFGRAGADALTGGRGNDTLEGGTGTDAAAYGGVAQDFSFGWRSDGYLVITDLNIVVSDAGTDALRGVETLGFNDRTYTIGAGGEFRVATQTAGNQSNASVTALDGGGYVVTWVAQDPNSGQSDIYAQVYNAAGAFRSDEVLVNSLVSGDQIEPAVTALDGGGFAIAWRSAVNGTSDIYVRRFGAVGGALAPEVRVNDSTSYDEYTPAVATLNDGDFVVTWTSLNQDGDAYGVYARRFDSAGVAQGSEIAVTQYTTSYQWHPSVAATANGGFIVSWDSYGQDGDQYGIYARQFDSIGGALGGSLGNDSQQNGTTANSQTDSDVATFADGSHVVVWTTPTYNPDTLGYDYDIWAQRFDSSGTGQDEFRINNAYTNAQTNASVATLGDGGFVVVWISDASEQNNSEIYARRFNAAGTAITGDMLVNVTTGNGQSEPDVAALADGGYIVTWTSPAQDGSGYGVFARRFDASNQSANATLTGTGNSDVLDISGDGDLVAIGGAGNDTYRVNSGSDGVRENLSQGIDLVESSATFTLPANVEKLTLLGDASNAINGYGNSLDNVIVGNAAINYLFGYEGNNTLDGGGGADTMFGGYGNDTYYVDDGYDYASESWGYFYDVGGFDTVYSSVDYSLHGSLNDLILTGSAVLGYGDYLPNRLTGNAGGNALNGNYGDDTLIGGAGNDTLEGSDGADTASYADSANGVTIDLNNVGGDQDSGGSGIERLSNIENLIGTSQPDNFTGNDVANYFQGGAGGDSMIGGAGADTLDGGTGQDTLEGGAGDDLYIVDGITDVVQGEVDGIDTVRSPVGWTLDAVLDNLELTGAATVNGTGNESANTMTGNDASNVLNGLGGDDDLRGGLGNDTLNGGDGDDALNGGAGGDAMSGGTGNDTINGGVFLDRAKYTGNAGDFQFGMSATGELLITDMNTGVLDEGADQLRNVDLLDFTDQDYAVRDGERQLNTTAAGDQHNPALAGRSEGGFVSVWEGPAADGSLHIFGQLYDANGVTDAYQFRIDTGSNEFARQNASVVSLANDGFVVAWQSQGQDGSGWGIYAQRYTAAGTRAGSEFKVNAETAGDQQYAVTTVLQNGDFVIAWQSSGQDGSGEGIYARRYNANGAPQGAEILVNTTTTGDQIYPSIAAIGSGFVVTWASDDGSSNGIFGQQFNATGVALGGQFAVNTTPDDEQTLPKLAVLSSGAFVVTWSSMGQDGSGSGIYGRLYNSLGVPGDEFLVNTGTTAGDQYDATVSALSDGGFVVAWQSDGQDGSGLGIYERRFNSSGVAQGAAETRVNTYTSGNQYDVATAGLPTGGFVVGWTSNGGQDETGTSVHAQRFDTGGQARVTEIAGTASANLIDMSGPGALAGAGGAGNDIYIVNDNQLDRVIEISGGGVDTVRTTVDWTLSNTTENLELLEAGAGISGTGNPFNNKLTGNGSSNVLNGGAGNDTIDGGAGADVMTGGPGNDIFVVSDPGEAANIQENTGEGIDVVHSAITVSTLAPNVEQIVLLESGAPNVNAIGNLLANAITGNSGINSLVGGNGNDTLTGGGGADVLVGGGGNDTFFADLSDTLTDSGGTDTVKINASYVLLPNFEYLQLTGTGAWAGTGNGAANKITGNSNANTINGGVGADTMTGGGGNDTYSVDTAGDLVVELANGGTADKVITTALDTTLAPYVELLELELTSLARNGTGNDQDNQITGNDGPNDIDGGIGADTMAGGKDDDHYVVDNLGDVVNEEPNQGGNDLVQSSVDFTLGHDVEDLELTGTAIRGFGNIDPNSLTGNASANVLDGKGGDDTMTGGAGNDTYYVDQSTEVIVEVAGAGGGIDLVRTVAATFSLQTNGANVENMKFVDQPGINFNGTGNGGNNVIEGGSGNDSLSGAAGNDTLRGFAGSDTLNGGPGIDSMEGGTDNDYYYVDDPADVIHELSGGGGDDAAESTVDYTLSAFVERLLLAGTGDIDGTGNGIANKVTGNAGSNNLYGLVGDDTLDGGGGVDGKLDTMTGGAGDDLYFVYHEFDEVIEAPTALGAGDDPRNAAGGSNTDTVIALVSYTLRANVENLSLAGTGDFTGKGNELNNVIGGNGGANSLQGLAGSDKIAGGNGNDTLDGGAGTDTMGGGAGNDTYIVDSKNDVILPEGSSEGVDTVQSKVNYALDKNFENLILTGTAANGTGNATGNTLTGNGENNVLKGVGGADKLLGFAGADKLYGGLGKDTLSGGAGVDWFVFDTGLGTSNVDTITDFKPGTDKIVLDDDVFTLFDAAASTTLPDTKFFGSNSNNAGDAGDRIVYNQGTGALFYDQDGTGPLGGIKFAVLQDAPNITAADFLIIG